MKNKKIKTLITTLLLVSAILPSITFIGVSSNTLKNEAETRFKSDTRRILSNLTQATKSYNNLLSSAYLLFESDKDWSENISNKDSFHKLSDTINNISSLIGDSLADIGIYSIETNQLINKDGKISTLKDKEQDWYKEAMLEQGKLIEVSTTVDENNNVYVTYAKTLSSQNPDSTTTLKGIMYITLNLEELVGIAQNIVITNNSDVLLMDKNYNVIFDKAGTYNNENLLSENWLFDALRAKKGKFLESYVNGEKVLIYKEVDSSSNISIVATVPYKDINSAVLKALKPTLLFALVILAVIISSGYIFIRVISKPFSEIINTIKPLKNGDFSKVIPIKETYPIEVQDMIGTLNDIVNGISSILKKIQDVSSVVEYNSSTLSDITENSYYIIEDIVATTVDISSDTTSNVNRTETLSNVINELSDEIKVIQGVSNNILNASEKVTDLSEEGKNSLEELKESFANNTSLTTDVIENISKVSSVFGKINDITNTMRDITQQTNMLSLNASIEAAKAGESGKGFAVVANEVRNLSVHSEELTKEIDSYVDNISKRISELEKKINILSDTNDNTIDTVEVTTKKFLNILDAIDSLNKHLITIGDNITAIEKKREDVVTNLVDVTNASINISNSTNGVSASMEEQSAQLEEITASATQLSKLASELKGLLSQFIISNEEEDV